MVRTMVGIHRIMGLTVGLMLVGTVAAGCDGGDSGGLRVAPTATPMPPPVAITLRQIGITRSHEFEIFSGANADDIRLLVTVDDGSGQPETRVVPPEGASPFKVRVGQPVQLNQVVFRAPSAGQHLRLTIVAIEEDDSSWIGPLIGAAAAVASGGTALVVAASVLADPTVQDVLGGGNDPVGFYEAVWFPQDRWGSGRYEAVGSQDLLLWFDVEVGGEVRRQVSGAPRPTPTPELSAPTPTTQSATPTPTLPAATPTATPRPTPTAMPTPTRQPPTPTPTLRFLPTATPTATATPTPEPGEPTILVIVRPTRVRVLDDHDPFLAGNGEIYVVVAGSDADGPLSWAANAQTTLSLSAGEEGLLFSEISVGVSPPSSNIRVYLGVWEQDNPQCYPSFEAQLPLGPQLTFDAFVESVASLPSCGDDLVGQITFQLAPEVDNWSSGSDVATTGEGVVTSQVHQRTVGDSVVTFEVTVVVTTEP